MIADWLQRVIAYGSKHDIHGGREYFHFYCRCVVCHRNFSNITAPTLSVMIALLLETLLAAIVVPAIVTIQRNVYNTYPWQFPDIVGRKFPWPAAIEYQLCNSRSRDQQCRLVTESCSLGAWAHRQNMWDGHWPGLFELRGKISCDLFCAGIFQPFQPAAEPTHC